MVNRGLTVAAVLSHATMSDIPRVVNRNSSNSHRKRDACEPVGVTAGWRSLEYHWGISEFCYRPNLLKLCGRTKCIFYCIWAWVKDRRLSWEKIILPTVAYGTAGLVGPGWRGLLGGY